MGKKGNNKDQEDDNIMSRPANKHVRINTLIEANNLVRTAKDLINSIFVNTHASASSSSAAITSSTTTTSTTTSTDLEQIYGDEILASINEVSALFSSDKQEINIPNRLQVFREARNTFEAAKDLVKSIYFDADEIPEADDDVDDNAMDQAIANGENPNLVYEDEIIGDIDEITERITKTRKAANCALSDKPVADIPDGDFVTSDEVTTSAARASIAATTPPKVNVDLSKIKYAPVPKPLKGQFTIGLAIIGWNGKKKVPSKGEAESELRYIDNTYSQLSAGQFGFGREKKAIVVKVRYPAARKNINKAKAQARRELGQHDINGYLIGAVRSFSNGGQEANLINFRAFLHETGHGLDSLPGVEESKALGHATSALGKDNSDNYSFMGFGAAVPRLTLPQLFNEGWPSQSRDLPAEQAVAQYTLNSPAVDIPIETLYAKEHNPGCVRGVQILRPDLRQIFISYLPAKDDDSKGELRFFAHYRNGGKDGNGGGSQLFARFKDQHVQLADGVYVKRVGVYGNGNPVLRISPTPITAEATMGSESAQPKKKIKIT